MRAAGLAALLLAASAAPLAAQATDPTARVAAFAALPYWPGYWVSEHQAGTTIGGIAPEILEARANGTGISPDFMALSGATAPWNAEGKRRLAEKARLAPGRKALGWGFPMMMNAATPIQVLITPEEVLIVNAYNEVRHVYTDGRAMPPDEDLWPTVTGTSVGHWEGDTLVIETVMVTNPFAFFHGAPPLSEEARYRERMRLDGDTLRSTVTIEDPVTLSAPWTVELGWVRDEGFDRMVQIDWDNDRTGTDGTLNTIEPVEGENTP